MNKVFIALLLSGVLVLSGCSFGENPDSNGFDVQYKEPSMDDGIDEMFEHNDDNFSEIQQ